MSPKSWMFMRFSVMQSRMLRPGHNLKVLGPIVCLVLVLVVDNLVFGQRSPNHLLSDQTVFPLILLNIAVSGVDNYVSLSIMSASAFPPRVSLPRSGSEIAVPRAKLVRTTLRSLKRLPAFSAGRVYLSSVVTAATLGFATVQGICRYRLFSSANTTTEPKQLFLATFSTAFCKGKNSPVSELSSDRYIDSSQDVNLLHRFANWSGPLGWSNTLAVRLF